MFDFFLALGAEIVSGAKQFLHISKVFASRQHFFERGENTPELCVTRWSTVTNEFQQALVVLLAVEQHGTMHLIDNGMAGQSALHDSTNVLIRGSKMVLAAVSYE